MNPRVQQVIDPSTYSWWLEAVASFAMSGHQWPAILCEEDSTNRTGFGEAQVRPTKWRFAVSTRESLAKLNTPIQKTMDQPKSDGLHQAQLVGCSRLKCRHVIALQRRRFAKQGGSLAWTAFHAGGAAVMFPRGLCSPVCAHVYFLVVCSFCRLSDAHLL